MRITSTTNATYMIFTVTSGGNVDSQTNPTMIMAASGQGKKVKWTAYALYGSRGIVSNIVQRFLSHPRLFDIMCGRYSTYSRYNATADS